MARDPIQLVTSYPAIVGAVLVSLRESRGMTQAALAAKIDLASSTWSRIETGTSALTIDQLALAAQALGVRPSEIIHCADAVRDAVCGREICVEPTRLTDATSLGRVVLGGAMLRSLFADACYSTSGARVTP